MARPELPGTVERIAEHPAEGRPGLYCHPTWVRELPWLTQGITSGADMSLFGGSPAGAVVSRWLELGRRLGCSSLIHARQVHAAHVLLHRDAPAGLLIAGDADGHITNQPGLMLAVSVADCVPIFMVAPGRRAIAMLHGGWRGVAAGILERGVEALVATLQVDPADLRVHLGPAICGDCFEVGPEVPAGLGLSADAGTAGERSYIDLRAHLAQRAGTCGVLPSHVSVSAFCTRCGDSPFFSHRAGCRERQIAVLAIGVQPVIDP